MDSQQKYELKIQALREALRERVSAITDEYENKIADLRIELTEMALALQELQSREGIETPED
jgi:hypothetical protein